MKKTAVDYLFEKMDVIGYSDIPTSITASKEVWGQIYKKAKEMEKEQITEAFLDGYKSHPYLSEQYYKENYQKK